MKNMENCNNKFNNNDNNNNNNKRTSKSSVCDLIVISLVLSYFYFPLLIRLNTNIVGMPVICYLWSIFAQLRKIIR